MEHTHAINSHPRTYQSSPEMCPVGTSRAPGTPLTLDAWTWVVLELANRVVSHFDAHRATRTQDFFQFINEEVLWLATFLLHRKRASADTRREKMTYWQDPAKVARNLNHDIRAGIYRPHPIRTELIPKGDGTMRKLGLPALRDKLLQMAVLLVLDPVIDRFFLDQSVGFRLGRRPQEAIIRVRSAIERWKTAWVIDVDIRDYFGSIPHERLMAMILALTDQKTAALIGRILKSPTVESDGSRAHPTQGTPQGGVLSPLLANLYLHHALDLWLISVQNKFKGEIEFARFADDIIVVCEREEDAQHLWPLVQTRLSSFGLEVNTMKSGLADMTRPDKPTYREGGQESFKFLGFQFKWVPDANRAWRLQNAMSDQSIAKSQLRFQRWLESHGPDNSIAPIDALGRRMAGFYSYYLHPLDEDTLSLARHNSEMEDLILTRWLPLGLAEGEAEMIRDLLAIESRKEVRKTYPRMEHQKFKRQKASGLMPIETIPSPALSTADADQMGKRFRR